MFMVYKTRLLVLDSMNLYTGLVKSNRIIFVNMILQQNVLNIILLLVNVLSWQQTCFVFSNSNQATLKFKKKTRL